MHKLSGPQTQDELVPGFREAKLIGRPDLRHTNAECGFRIAELKKSCEREGENPRWVRFLLFK